MKSAFIIVAVFFAVYTAQTEALPDLTRSELYDCMVCLCHAVSGCWRRENCARYSISQTYWKSAGSPTGNYNGCMHNENCILNTIQGYTNTFDNQDCNCDGNYDCRDMLALHLGGSQCKISIPSVNTMRYNKCARMKDLPQFAANNANECATPEAQ